jgi:hypothetical protein
MMIFFCSLFGIKNIVKITTCVVSYVILVYCCVCSVHKSPVMKQFAQLLNAVLFF